MKKALLLTTALLLLIGVAVYAGPGKCGKNCQANCEMSAGPGMGQQMGHGMAPRAKAGRGMRGHGMMQRGDGAQRLLMLADKLELTDAQKTKIQDMMTSFRLEQIDRRAAMQKAQVRMADLRHNEKATEAQIFAAMDELAKLRLDMQKAQYRHREAMQNVLTDKQKTQLKEMRQDRMQGMGRMPGMGRMGDMQGYWEGEDDFDMDDLDDLDSPEPPDAPEAPVAPGAPAPPDAPRLN